MSADSITGQVDNCLFSLHKPQSIGRTSEEDLKDAEWSRMVGPIVILFGYGFSYVLLWFSSLDSELTESQLIICSLSKILEYFLGLLQVVVI